MSNYDIGVGLSIAGNTTKFIYSIIIVCFSTSTVSKNTGYILVFYEGKAHTNQIRFVTIAFYSLKRVENPCILMSIM